MSLSPHFTAFLLMKWSKLTLISIVKVIHKPEIDKASGCAFQDFFLLNFFVLPHIIKCYVHFGNYFWLNGAYEGRDQPIGSLLIGIG